VSTTDEVLAAARHLVQAFGRHDTAAYFGCFAPDATFIFHTTAGRLASRAEYRRLRRQWEDDDEFRVLSCASAQPLVQDLGDTGVFSHDVTTVIRTRAGEQTLTVGHHDSAGDQAVAPLVVAADVHQQGAIGLGVECLGGRGAVWQHGPGLGEQLIDGLWGATSGHLGLRIG
jgi:SnoaL-like domain